MIEQIQRKIGYQFRSPSFLQEALTHSSAVNEHTILEKHNERLEFLGDAVLELCVSRELYTRFPSAREGQLTALRSKMVNQTVLAEIAGQLGLDQWIIMGKGEENQGGRLRASLLSDALEALIGAVFLDAGFECSSTVVLQLFASHWPERPMELKGKDAKSLLQELCQRLFKERPSYSLIKSSGPEHEKRFFVVLTLPNEGVFHGEGASVKRAEQNAARAALSLLQAQSMPERHLE